jgi:hypothetical protein
MAATLLGQLSSNPRIAIPLPNYHGKTGHRGLGSKDIKPLAGEIRIRPTGRARIASSQAERMGLIF